MVVKRRISLVLLAVMICLLSVLPVYASQANDEENHDIEDCYVSGFGTGRLENDVDLGDTPVIKVNGGRRSSVLPEKYDPRGESFITPVKSQGPVGSCWVFASLATMESSLIKSGLAPKELDLSELHFLYFLFNENKGDKRINDDRNYVAGDNKNIISSDFTKMADLGGYSLIAGWQAANRVMPIDRIEDHDSYLEAVKNKDFKLDEALCYASPYRLKNFRMCSATATYEDESNIELVKKLVYEYGGVTASFYCEQTTTNGSSKYFQIVDGNRTYYNPNGKNMLSSHEVEIIGWDDNYSRENFKVMPEKDGAWLAKNSWGTADSNGFLWLSYYDMACDAEALAYEFESSSISEGIYQYDGGDYGKVSFKPGYENVYIETFIADQDEYIEYVGVGTEANASYEIAILKDPVFSEASTIGYYKLKSASKKASTFCTTDFAGYYKQRLSEPVFVKKGEEFAVYVKADAGTGIYGSDSEQYYNGRVVTIEKAPENGIIYQGIDDSFLTTGDIYAISVKAYSNPKVYKPVEDIVVDKESLSLDMSYLDFKLADLNVEIVPSDGYPGLSFETSDENVAALYSDPSDPKKVVVMAVGTGNCSIYVYSHDRKIMKEVSVTVVESSDTDYLVATTNSGELSYNVDENGLLRIAGIGDYQAELEDQDTGELVPGWCEYADIIRSVKIMGGGLTNTDNMLYGLYNLESVDVSGVIEEVEIELPAIDGIWEDSLGNTVTSIITGKNNPSTCKRLENTTSVCVDHESVNLKEGEVFRVKATVLSANAKQAVSFESSNTTVAKVIMDPSDEKKMTAVISARKEGQCEITVWDHNKGKSAKVKVTVYKDPTQEEPEPSSEDDKNSTLDDDKNKASEVSDVSDTTNPTNTTSPTNQSGTTETPSVPEEKAPVLVTEKTEAPAVLDNPTASETSTTPETPADSKIEKKVIVKTPKKSVITFLKIKKNAITVKWKKIKNAKGYEIQIALNKKFTKGKRKLYSKKLTASIKNIKEGKQYYLRVRAYNQGTGGKKVYGKWSKTIISGR